MPVSMVLPWTGKSVSVRTTGILVGGIGILGIVVGSYLRGSPNFFDYTLAMTAMGSGVVLVATSLILNAVAHVIRRMEEQAPPNRPP